MRLQRRAQIGAHPRVFRIYVQEQAVIADGVFEFALLMKRDGVLQKLFRGRPRLTMEKRRYPKE